MDSTVDYDFQQEDNQNALEEYLVTLMIKVKTVT